MTLVAVFLGLALIGIACAVSIVILAVNAGPACPACGEETILIRASWIGRHTPWLEERLCTTCGWNGLTRRIRKREIYQGRSENIRRAIGE